MNEQYLGLLFTAMCICFNGGFLVGTMWWTFRANERDSTARFPRPGTQPQRPEGFKPFKRHPDMLAPIDPDETKKP